MKSIGIVGSRGFRDQDLLKSVLLEYVSSDTVIVSGGARGADQLGASIAKELSLETIIYKPNWRKYGKSAGAIRNRKIVKASDMVIAFWDGRSPGTRNTIDTCQQTKTPCRVERI